MAYTADLTTGQTFAASDAAGSSANNAFNDTVTDGNGWLTSDGVGANVNQWISCQFSGSKVIKQIKVVLPFDLTYTNRCMQHAKIEASNNGSSWTKIPITGYDGVYSVAYNTDEVTFTKGTALTHIAVLTIAPTTQYTYYRIFAYDNYGDGRLGCNEIEMMETIPTFIPQIMVING